MENINSVACLNFLLIMTVIILDYQTREVAFCFFFPVHLIPPWRENFQTDYTHYIFYCNLNKMNSKCLLAGTALSDMKTSMLEKTALVEVWYKFRAIFGDTEKSRLYPLLVLPGKLHGSKSEWGDMVPIISCVVTFFSIRLSLSQFSSSRDM